MIQVENLIVNLDAILGENMFLKDAKKAENLKNSVQGVFNNIIENQDMINSTLDCVLNQSISNNIEIKKIQDSFKNYLKQQIDFNKMLLYDLGESY